MTTFCHLPDKIETVCISSINVKRINVFPNVHQLKFAGSGTSMMSPDRLVEIKNKDLSILRHLYASNGLKNSVAYITFDNYIRWFDQDSDLKHITFFCLNGDFSDGTFVLIDLCFVYVDTFSASSANLERLLQLLDYTKSYTFVNIRHEHGPVIKNVLHKFKVEITSDYTQLLYFLPNEEALKFDTR